MSIRYILGSDSLTAFVGGKPYTINRSAEIFDKVLEAVRNDDEQAFKNLVEIKATIVNMFGDNKELEIKSNRLYCNGREITGLIATRVLEMLKFKLDINPMANFVAKLMKNPSKRAVDEAFSFVDACKLPITASGNILAYRRVRADYLDNHSKTVPNKPASEFSQEELDSMPIQCGKKNEVKVYIDTTTGDTVVETERNNVDENKDRTCSEGLHFCSYEYLAHFPGERIIVVEIDPADIVAIPSDYNNAKGRCSRYLIVDEIPVEQNVYRQEYAMPVKQIDVEYSIQLEETKKVPTNTKMTTQKAGAFRKGLAQGKSLREMCKLYGISRRQGARIRDGQAWV